MIRITQLKLPVQHTKNDLKRSAAALLRCRENEFTFEIRKQSLDARHKEEKKFVYTLDVFTDKEQSILSKVHHISCLRGNSARSSSGRDGQRPGRAFLCMVPGQSRLPACRPGKRR